jgi:mitochondrial fission protein ELM1
LSEAAGGHPLAIWIVSDGKPGHVNQSLGLAEALARATPAAIHTLPALPRGRAVYSWLLRRPVAPDLPAPDLLLGAGHATHLTLLAARRAHGGRAVVLMKPSLPRRCFDLCIVPRHDGIAPDTHTLVSEGALNRVRPAHNADPMQGLILVGGPSAHFEWNTDALLAQIEWLLAHTPGIRWTLTTSRRTPADFAARLPASPTLEIVPHTATTPDWLPAQFARCGTACVTPDSASMVYEALTAGAAVGVFDFSVKPGSRVAQAITWLADAGRITRFADWRTTGTLPRAAPPLAEAERCAHWIIEWLKKNRQAN